MTLQFLSKLQPDDQVSLFDYTGHTNPPGETDFSSVVLKQAKLSKVKIDKKEVWGLSYKVTTYPLGFMDKYFPHYKRAR